MSGLHKNLNVIFLAITLIVSACAAPTAESAAAPTVAASPFPSATASPLPPTETLTPTATPAPTQTPSPTSVTPSLSAWCLPQESLAPTGSMEQPWVMPAGARPATAAEGGLQLIVPDRFCTFVYTFGQPLPAGARLDIYDNNASPWLQAELKPVPDTPNNAYVILDHSYIVDPPYWQIAYRFVVRAPNGQEPRSDTLIFDKGWRPELCWNGALPNPVTLKCIKQQDLHPWDIGYQTVFPPAPE